jgi:imidazolonepropionase
MSNSDRIVFRQAAQVLTLSGPAGPRGGKAMAELGILHNASVVVDRGQIAWVGPDAELTPMKVGSAQEVDCRGRALMPAFVDSHTHLVWGGDRRDELEMRLAGADYEAIFAKGGGILSSVRQTRAASEDDLFEQSRRRMDRMRQSGTTTFEIKSGYGLDLETELRQLRVARRLASEAGARVRTTCLAAHAVPEEARENEDTRAAFVQRVCEEMLPQIADSGLADYCDVFCDRGAFTPGESRAVLGAAQGLSLGLRVHANEFGHTGGALVAAEFRAKSADHLLHLNTEERKALREAGVVATLLPGTSLVLGKPFADGRSIVDDGLAVAVASDCNPGSCAFENLAMVLALACYGCRLSPAEAICATTHNAAASLDLDGQVGRLESGMSADLLVLGTNDYRDLIYHAASPLIDQVWSMGHRIA